jgi:hypothetical protein
MDIQTLINELYIIYDNNDDYHLIELYRILSRFNIEIHKYITNLLYDNWITELQTVEYEAIFGNGDEFSEYVVSDCMNVLKQILDELMEIEKYSHI